MTGCYIIWFTIYSLTLEAISREDISEEVGKTLNRFAPLYEEIKVLKRQRKYILEDLEDDASDQEIAG